MVDIKKVKKPVIESDPRILAYLNIPPPDNISKADYLFMSLNAIVIRMMNLEVKHAALEKRVTDSNKSCLTLPGQSGFKL